MSILSDRDFRRELGNNILIYPFDEGNLKGASYNLTASKLAWCINDEKTAFDGTKIIIPKKSTVLIHTNEIIWVSNKIAGTYHSKVSLVSKGIGHIGTTLDPEYIGSSLITLHNHSEHDITLTPEEDIFVSIVFYYVKTKSSVSHGNLAGRPDILNNIHKTLEESKWLDESFRKDIKPLKLKLQESESFKKIKKNLFGNMRYYLPYIICGSLFIISFVVYCYCLQNKAIIDESIYNTIIMTVDRLMILAFGALIGQITTDIRRG
jgi:deoxycytidine triphosphate deaminase